MIYDPSSYQGWVSPHIYYLQRRNPFFFSFFLLFSPSTVFVLVLPLVLTLLLLIFTPNKVKPNGVIAPISTVEQLLGSCENGSNRSQKRHWMYFVLCYCLYTDVAWAFGDTQFNFCNMHIKTERQQSQATRTQSNVKIIPLQSSHFLLRMPRILL